MVEIQIKGMQDQRYTVAKLKHFIYLNVFIGYTLKYLCLPFKSGLNGSVIIDIEKIYTVI